MRIRKILPLLVVAALVSSCDSSPTTPEVNVDQLLSQMSTGGISTYSTAAPTSSGASVASLSVPPGRAASDCSYNGATKFFVCAPVTANGLTLARSFQLLDASGSPLAEANPLLVASIRSVIDLDGTTTTPAPNAATIQVTRHEDATLSGIQSASRVLNGNATQRTVFTGSAFAFTSNDTSATSNLQLPASPDQKYPLGGTITTDRTVSLSSVTTSSHHEHTEISFDGSSIMTVKIVVGTTSSVTMTCKVNLATPGVAPTCT
jgi:hypothetical protein